jgi:hypothetical protein
MMVEVSLVQIKEIIKNPTSYGKTQITNSRRSLSHRNQSRPSTLQWAISTLHQASLINVIKNLMQGLPFRGLSLIDRCLNHKIKS